MTSFLCVMMLADYHCGVAGVSTASECLGYIFVCSKKIVNVFMVMCFLKLLLPECRRLRADEDFVIVLCYNISKTMAN